MPQKTQEQLAAEAALAALQKKYEILRTIATKQGFYQTWFNSLPKYKSGADAFHALNETYYQVVLPHRYKYSSYSNFLRANKKK